MISWRPEWAETPEFKAEMARVRRRERRITRLTSWMRHIPVIGSFTASFWYLILDDGIVSALKPRWGGITFAYLNDGIRPTVWHTWRQMTHSHDDPYTGIYPNGAPKSLAQAEEWEAKWAADRAARPSPDLTN